MWHHNFSNNASKIPQPHGSKFKDGGLLWSEMFRRFHASLVTQTDTEDLYAKAACQSNHIVSSWYARNQPSVTTHGIRRGESHFRRLVSRRNFYFRFLVCLLLVFFFFYLLVMFLLMASSLFTNSFSEFSDMPYWSTHFKKQFILWQNQIPNQ